MKTIEKLISKFNNLFPNYTASLDKIESYNGYYRIYIADKSSKIGSWYTFKSCNEFSEWFNGVVLE